MPKISASSLEEHRRQTRERIFAALEQLVAEEGYDSITLAEIAAAADVGRTVIYNYYPDKEELLLAWAEQQSNGYQRRLATALRRAGTPAEELRTFIRMQLRELSSQHMQMGSLRAVLSENGHKRMAAHAAPLVAMLRDILERAVQEGDLPGGDLELMLPLVLASIAGRSTGDLRGRALDRAIEATTVFVLRGLGARLDATGLPVRTPDTQAVTA